MRQLVWAYVGMTVIVSAGGQLQAEEPKPRVVFNDDAQMLAEAPLEGTSVFVKAWLDQEVEAVPFSTYVFLAATPDICTFDSKAGETYGDRFGLGFSATDREENIRRIGAVAEIFTQTGIIALTAFISPYRIDRDKVRNTLKEGEFIEVFVDAPIEVCEQRDPKGLYKKARAGEIKGFTGIDDPYEEPVAPELILLAAEKTPDILADEVISLLQNKGIL